MKNKDSNNIEDDLKLATEFANIGFDFKTMLNNARYVNLWTILLSADDQYCYAQNFYTIVFSFTIIIYGNRGQRSIYHIRATLLKSKRNSNQSNILIAKDYWNYNGPLPTKEEICDDMATMLRKTFWTSNENFELN